MDDGLSDKDPAVYRLAEEHWQYLEKLIHVIFVDAFVHGYKHGEAQAYGSIEQDLR